MSISETLAELTLELDRTHTSTYHQSDAFRTDRDFPDFATAANGEVRNFYRDARKKLAIITDLVYENNPAFSKQIDEKRFAQILQQAVVDLHASGALSDVAKQLKVLINLLSERVQEASQTFTHSIPAWTCGIEEAGEWAFGRISFMTWPQWVTHVDFPDHAKATFLQQPEDNARWKELLVSAIRDKDAPVPGLAGYLVNAATSCPAVLRVEISGMDANLSRKLAEIACKGALDSISLIIGQQSSFLQQALQVERLPPAGIDSIIESRGYLWLPGTSLTGRVNHLRNARVQQFVRDSSTELQAMAHAVNGLLDRSHPHPQLASRWTTALDWYAEGQRERGDAIALAKLGTCLDVLACGGKFLGILGLLTNLLGVAEDAPFTRRTKQTTLRAVVKDIYDNGRSQILHGSRHDRMEAFEVDRKAASHLARWALIEAALRLKSYSGADDRTAFRTMQASPS